MIAGLGMYDWPEVRDATDGLWAAIAGVLKKEGFDDAPETLERGLQPYDLWHSPDLLLAQTCGYPLVTQLVGKCNYVATPCYDVPGCDGANYSSIILVRASDGPDDVESAKGSRAAINGADSMSGHIALKAVIAPFARNARFFSDVALTGTHAASMAAVRDGQSDICAIDCVSYALAVRYRPELVEGLKEIGQSPQVPGLPLISSPIIDGLNKGQSCLKTLRSALKHVYSDPSTREIRQALFISGLAVLPDDAYMAIHDLSDEVAGLSIVGDPI